MTSNSGSYVANRNAEHKLPHRYTVTISPINFPSNVHRSFCVSAIKCKVKETDYCLSSNMKLASLTKNVNFPAFDKGNNPSTGERIIIN